MGRGSTPLNPSLDGPGYEIRSIDIGSRREIGVVRFIWYSKQTSREVPATFSVLKMFIHGRFVPQPPRMPQHSDLSFCFCITSTTGKYLSLPSTLDTSEPIVTLCDGSRVGGGGSHSS